MSLKSERALCQCTSATLKPCLVFGRIWWGYAGKEAALAISLSSAQVRGARGMLNWSQLDLAKAAHVSASTIQRIEDAERRPVSEDVHALIRGALEEAGVRFLSDEGDGGGLRLLSTEVKS